MFHIGEQSFNFFIPSPPFASVPLPPLIYFGEGNKNSFLDTDTIREVGDERPYSKMLSFCNLLSFPSPPPLFFSQQIEIKYAYRLNFTLFSHPPYSQDIAQQIKVKHLNRESVNFYYEGIDA